MAYKKTKRVASKRTSRNNKRAFKRTGYTRRSASRATSARSGTLKIVVESGTARPATLADASVVSRAKLRTL